MGEISREDLIALCERGRVPQVKWMNRDSAGAQTQLGEAWALLSAGCEFEVLHETGGLDSNAETWWIAISYEGFNFHESFSAYDGDNRADYLEPTTPTYPPPRGSTERTARIGTDRPPNIKE